METAYFIGISLGGAALTLFTATGWSSYKHKKIPEKPVLFRWFVAGLVAAGLVAYAWIFGAKGDVGGALKKIGGALDIDAVQSLSAIAAGAMATVSSLSGGGGDSKKDSDANGTDAPNMSINEVTKGTTPELTVGMPAF